MNQYSLTTENGSTLVVTILVLVILSILGTAALTLTNTEFLIARNMKLKTKSFYLAEAGVEKACSVIRDVNGTLDDGSYVAYVSEPYKVQNATNSSLLWDVYEFTVNSTGYCQSSESNIQIKAFMKRLPINSDAAMGIYTQGANATAETTTQGNPLIDGDDYGLPDNFHCSGSDCDVSLPLVNGTGTDGLYMDQGSVEIKGSAEITPDPKFGNGTYSNAYWKSMAEKLVPVADNVIDDTLSEDVTLGTRDEPQVTVLGDNTKLSGTVNGAGILIVHGNAQVTGNFHFEGQVIILGNEDEDIKLFTAGTPYIYGSVAVAGSPNAIVDVKGNAQIKYSQLALKNAGKANKSIERAYWREF
ncbi:MAG: PilX N-terminal domain-containing pilus assembly protein [Desulfovermiculus sp.]|nr:PilX N-terminal domain-containing pilus assembly protein [Desulfovermiculus sp.]